MQILRAGSQPALFLNVYTVYEKGDFDMPLQGFQAHFFQQLCFGPVQPVGQIYIDFLGIDQTFGFIPESFFFAGADVADLHDRGGCIDAAAFQKDRDQ